jgi:hypothetical protein
MGGDEINVTNSLNGCNIQINHELMAFGACKSK